MIEDYNQDRLDRFFRETFLRLKAMARIMLPRLGRELDVTEDDLAQEAALAGFRHLERTWMAQSCPVSPPALTALENAALGVAITALKRDCIDLVRREQRQDVLKRDYTRAATVGLCLPDQASMARQELAQVASASQVNPEHKALFEASQRLGDGSPEEISREAGLARVKFYRWRSTINRRFGGRN